MPNSDEELLLKAVGGDEAALCDLLERVGLTIQSEITRKIGPQYNGTVEADDIMQVTCLEAFLRIRQFAPTGANAFVAWLRRIAENNLRDAIRELERDKRPSPGKRVRAGGDDSYVELIERIAASSATASRAVARDEAKGAVQRALEQLPPDYALAVRLYDLDGLSGPEVAERMGRSHGAVRMMLARARERLAEVMGAESKYFSTGA